MQRIICIFTVAIAGILLIDPLPAIGEEAKVERCEGKFKGGKKPTREELAKVLEDSGESIISSEERGTRANLCEANPEEVNLSGAALSEASLSGANLGGANLAFTIFELKPGSLPTIQTVALARNLSRMTFPNTPLSLVELREEFKKKGLRRQEREVTFAIRSTERRKALEEGGVWGKIESPFTVVFFEITSDYGMSYGRPLLILLGLIPLFAIPYMFVLKSHRRSGIWIVLPEDRVHKSNKAVHTVQECYPRFRGHSVRGHWVASNVTGLR